MIINSSNLANLFTGYKAAFQQAFVGAPAQWDRVATPVPSSNASEDYAWLKGFPKLREWIGDRHIKSLEAGKYSIRNKPFESTVGVPRAEIERDNYGIYTPLMSEMGYAAKTHPDELIFALLAAGNSTLCYDGQFFFDNDHPVGSGVVSNWGGGAGALWALMDVRRPLKPLIFQKEKDYSFVPMTKEDDEAVFMRAEYRYGVDARCNVGFGFWQMAYGSKQTLDATAYEAARAALGNMKSDEGRPLGVNGNLLVVGQTNEGPARRLLESQVDASGASNPWYKSAELLVCPWLV